MHKHAKRRQALMTKKYYSMLLGGTLTMMVVSILLMSDSVIAGAVIGPDAVAGVTLVTPLYSLAAFFGSVFSMGVPILYTTEMGKFNKERADQAFGLGVLMCLVVGVVLFLGTSLFGDMYLRSSAPPEGVLEQARGYLFWMRFTILLLPMQTLIGAAVYSDGDENISTIADVVQGLGNIVCSIVLSRFMGIRGIGLASFLFYVASIVILLAHFLKKTNSLRWNLYFSMDILKEVLRYSIIDSSSYLFLAALTAVINAFVSAQFGAEYLILASAVTLCREFQLVFDGIGEAIGPIFSVYLGEESECGLRASYALAKRSAIVEGIAVTLLLLLFAPFVPRFLNVDEPALARWVVTGIRWLSLGSVFISLLYLLTSYYMVIDQIALGVLGCALRDVVLGVGLAVGLGKAFGINGMFIGLAAAPALAYLLMLLYISLRFGRGEFPLLLSMFPSSKNSYLFNLTTEPEEIIGVQQQVEESLKKNGVNRKTIVTVMLLIEEMYMFIRQMNGDKPVLAECTVLLRPEGVQIISKDDGVSFDMADEDLSTKSLSAYTLAMYLEKRDFGNRHLTTMSFNRSSFFIRFKQD